MATEEDRVIGIPPEIITEILRRLPSKSLGRFKCVSKDWLTLISQPQFIKIHQNTLNRSHLIFLADDTSIYSLPFNHHESRTVVSSTPTNLRLELPRLSMFSFEGCCNGLVLVTAHDLNSRNDTLVILNPTTREFLELGDSIHYLYGFGYDPLTDDYKVFAISYTSLMSVHVYSLRTKTWKKLIDSPHYLPYGRWLRGVFVNGFFYWIAKKKDEESHEYLPVILAFSLADEQVSEVPLPNWSNDHVVITFENVCKLAVVGEKLAIVLDYKGEVWLMNDYGVRESWTKILAHKLENHPIVEPMILYNNGKVLLASEGRVLIYDVEKSSFCGSIDYAAGPDHLCIKCICSESIVSPKFSC